jgi:hypothetical protein
LPKELRFLSRVKEAPQIRAPQFRDLRKAISLAFQIEHWKPSYSLAMVPHGSRDRCEERVGYDIFTTCVAPRKFAGTSTAFRLLGAANKLEAEYESAAPLALISMRGKSPEYIGSVSPDELHRAVQHVTAGLYSYITVISDLPGRGYADVHVMGFKCDLDPDEFPEVAAGRN